MLMCEAVESTHNQGERGFRFGAAELKGGSSPIICSGARVASRGARRVEEEREWHTQPEMPPSQHPARINLHDLKAQIVKRVGPDKANQYFAHFRSFISSRLKKQELEKLVVLTIGKENVALHNQLVRAVLSNAIRSEVPPPPPPAQDVSKPVKGVRRKPLSPSISNDDTFSQISPWSNGDSFPTSPRKGRSGIRDRKAHKDRPSPLGPQGRGELPLSQASLVDDAAAKSGSIEDLKSPDLSRPLQEIEGAAHQSDAERNSALVPPVKRLRVLPRIELAPLDVGRGGEPLSSEFEEEDEERHREEFLPRVNNSIRAPLGIPFCPGSVGAARKAPFLAFPGPLSHLLLVDGTEEEFLDASDLPDADTMQRRMDQIATVEGLQGVSRDCADMLNQALDVLLKRLVKACVDLVGSRSGRDQETQAVSKDTGSVWDKDLKECGLSAMKMQQGPNGVWAGSTVEVARKDREKPRPPVSLLDFKVAMDLNPQQLGEDWPVQLEKLSFRIFDQ